MVNLFAKVVNKKAFIAILAQTVGVLPVYAAGITLNNPSDVVTMICSVAAAMFWVLIAVSVIMVLYGAFLYLTGGADAEKVKTAHKTIAYAAVGVLVALLAKGFPFIVASIVNATGLSGGC
jgi:hypothetical protein